MNNTLRYNYITNKMRQFFRDEKGFVEVPASSRLSILAACEDPRTISLYSMGGQSWPLPQTGQMWLEVELLKNPTWKGVFCLGTSYRNEPNPIPGRHNLMFPMFEFEAPGDFSALKKIERELLEYIGFAAPVAVDYEESCRKYGCLEIKAEQEAQMDIDFGHEVSLEKFPLRANPFWNMKHAGNGLFNKIDVILHGAETIGSAERSTNVEEMRDVFFTISDGEYAGLFFKQFGKDRIMKELDEYLSLNFFPRFGGGIGVTRVERAMERAGLLDHLPVHEQTYHEPIKYVQTSL